MSAQPISPTTAAPHFSVVQHAPIFGSYPVAVVPTSQPCTHVHPTVTPTQEPPTLYPPPQVELKTQQTYAWIHSEPITALAQNDHGSWLCSIPVFIPSDIINPTLTSLVYVIKYGTTLDNGNSTVQADIVLTTTELPTGENNCGIIFNPTDLGIYREGSAYSARMVKEDSALRLSMVPAVKCNGGNSQWSHYIDHRHLLPNVRVTQPSYLYLIFHVNEYPTTQTSRALDIEVSASWAEDLEARKAKEEAERAAAAAPPVADKKTQVKENIAEKYGQKYGGGSARKKTATGYAW